MYSPKNEYLFSFDRVSFVCNEYLVVEDLIKCIFNTRKYHSNKLSKIVCDGRT